MVISAALGFAAGIGITLLLQQIAVNHGGRIEARNHSTGGACMDLLLPREPLQ